MRWRSYNDKSWCIGHSAGWGGQLWNDKNHVLFMWDWSGQSKPEMAFRIPLPIRRQECFIARLEGRIPRDRALSFYFRYRPRKYRMAGLSGDNPDSPFVIDRLSVIEYND